MKKNQIKEIALKSKEELFKLLSQLKSEAAAIEIEHSSRKLKNVALLGEKKKTIARVLTFIREKELK